MTTPNVPTNLQEKIAGAQSEAKKLSSPSSQASITQFLITIQLSIDEEGEENSNLQNYSELLDKLKAAIVETQNACKANDLAHTAASEKINEFQEAAASFASARQKFAHSIWMNALDLAQALCIAIFLATVPVSGLLYCIVMGISDHLENKKEKGKKAQHGQDEKVEKSPSAPSYGDRLSHFFFHRTHAAGKRVATALGDALPTPPQVYSAQGFAYMPHI